MGKIAFNVQRNRKSNKTTKIKNTNKKKPDPATEMFPIGFR
jgi:hypothetical protein